MSRWLTLALFVISVAVPSGMADMAMKGHADHAAHHGHGAPAGVPADHGPKGCGDCGQPVFCCSHSSIVPIGATGDSPALGGYIILIAPQQAAVSAFLGSPYHPPRA